MKRWFRRNTPGEDTDATDQNKHPQPRSADSSDRKGAAASEPGASPIRIGGAAAKASAPTVRLRAVPRNGSPTPSSDVPSGAPPAPPAVPVSSRRTLYKQLMNGFYDAILITDNKGHIVESNVRAPELFGFSNDELWDMRIAGLIAGLDEGLFERIRTAIDGERRVLINTRCTRKDETQFPAEVGISVVAMLGKDDFVFTVRNVERRAAQLRTLRAGQNAFMASLAGGFICDAGGNLVTVNNAFLELLQLNPAEPVAGMPLTRFWPGLEQQIETLQSGAMQTCRCKAGVAGTERDFSVSLAPNRTGTNTAEGFVGSIIPVSPSI